jgi:putative cofactor-binding repeat protein/predicted outer membrane repeat protein
LRLRSFVKNHKNQKYNPMKTISPLFPFLAACILAQTAFAASITVTTTADSGPGSLRDAIVAASSGDVIGFDPALAGQTISLTTGQIAIAKPLTLNGPGAANLAISGNNASRIFTITAAANITGLTFENGKTSQNGGAILAATSAALTISDSVFSKNSSPFGGGALFITGAVSILRCTFSGNTVMEGNAGGAIFANNGTLTLDHSIVSGNSSVGGFGLGAGIYSAASVTVTESTISGNTIDFAGTGGGFYNAGVATFRNSTVSGNSAGEGGQGGAVYNQSGGRLATTVTILNSTIAGNAASPSGQGGGIFNDSTVSLSNSTLAQNSAGSDGSGGGIFNNGATLNVANTIFAGNTALAGPDVFGAVKSQGFDLIGNAMDSSGWTGNDLFNTDPLLGPLQDNGGSTATMALLPGSPAIDHGDPGFDPNAFTPPMVTDQRGGPRTINGQIDIGSFEADVAHFPAIDSLTAPQTLECASHQGTDGSITVEVSDSQGHSLTVQWFVNNQLAQTDQIPGTQPTTQGSSTYTATFPDGTTNITVSVTDGGAAPVTQSTSVTVGDTTPPTISSVSASPNVLSPPNHKMVAVSVSVSTTDICDPNPTSKIISVASNEPEPNEFQITGDLTLNLQAERNGGGNGRMYEIIVQSTDASGNSSTRTVTVAVPKGGETPAAPARRSR